MLLTSSPVSLFCAMEKCRKAPLLLMNLVYITLLPVFQAQGIISQSKVTGYLWHNVSLPCKFTPGPMKDVVTQVQWGFRQTEQNVTTILVSHQSLGLSIHDTFLKDKVGIQEQSLIISNLEERDAGLYACKISAFPGGSFEASIQLIVQEQMPYSSGEVSAIVIAVLSLCVLVAGVVYFMFIRRSDSSVRQHVQIDTRGSETKDEAVVYSHVKIKPSADAASSSSNKRADADDVTYSEVLVLYPQSKS